jgi:hypothetical protein
MTACMSHSRSAVTVGSMGQMIDGSKKKGGSVSHLFLLRFTVTGDDHGEIATPVAGLILGGRTNGIPRPVQTYLNYPGCAVEMADVSIVTRLASKCDMDANREFDSQRIQNPNYDPTKSPIVEPAAAKPVKSGQRLPEGRRTASSQ